MFDDCLTQLRGENERTASRLRTLHQYNGRLATVGVGFKHLTERTGRLAFRDGATCGLEVDGKPRQYRLGDVHWILEPDTSSKIWLE